MQNQVLYQCMMIHQMTFCQIFFPDEGLCTLHTKALGVKSAKDELRGLKKKTIANGFTHQFSFSFHFLQEWWCLLDKNQQKKWKMISNLLQKKNFTINFLMVKEEECLEAQKAAGNDDLLSANWLEKMNQGQLSTLPYDGHRRWTLKIWCENFESFFLSSTYLLSYKKILWLNIVMFQAPFVLKSICYLHFY